MKLSKHILKKFSNQVTMDTPLDQANPDVFELDDPEVDFKDLLKKRKKDLLMIQTTESLTYLTAILNIDGTHIPIPLPDPTLVYFDAAYNFLCQIPERRKKLLDALQLKNNQLKEPAINEIYHYYSTTCGFTIFLFTAIESFINQQIPEDYKFSNVTNRRTEIYNKTQIQESIDFKTKLTKVLPDITGKNFFLKSTLENEFILKLKDFRDNIIHTKKVGKKIPYDSLLETALKFKYQKALDSVATFMNFYKKDYLTECPCSSTH